MTVSSLCSRAVDLARTTDTVHAAAQRMLQRNVGTLLVVDEARKPIGIVTDRDLVLKVLAAERDPRDTLVRDVMTKHPAMVTADAPIDAALETMRAAACRRLPVVDAHGALIGVLSMDDVLRRVAAYMGWVASVLRREGPDTLASSD